MTAYEGDHFLQAGFSFPIRMSDLDYFRLADHPPRIVRYAAHSRTMELVPPVVS